MQEKTDGRIFEPGHLVATPHVLASVPRADLFAALSRHLSGDWGDVCCEDKRTNDMALRQGERLLSSYRSSDGVKFWIITERDRSATTFLLPSDY